jgi:amidophosphoribosyltransferase
MCGVFGVFNSKTPAEDTFYGLYSLQHRGQEAAGIVVAEYNKAKKKTLFKQHKGPGLVSEVFRDEQIFENLSGYAAIGHNRYSTTGASKSNNNIQPFSLTYRSGSLAIAHNGNLTNSRALRKQLTEQGVIFQASSDTEIIPHLAARSKEKEPIHQIYEALRQVEGAYSIVILANNQMIAARDPYGVRPLALGKKIDPATGAMAYIVASETCAFDIIKAEYIRDIEPGEILLIDHLAIDNEKPVSIFLPPVERKARCIFEYVYFARPEGERQRAGRGQRAGLVEHRRARLRAREQQARQAVALRARADPQPLCGANLHPARQPEPRNQGALEVQHRTRRHAGQANHSGR